MMQLKEYQRNTLDAFAASERLNRQRGLTLWIVPKRFIHKQRQPCGISYIRIV